ncbi:argininosuccinate lyase [Bacillus carboniphilus]|uniref:Argininosuccinate lyase n=1 Tax=Bacillus carboniphilus TaxID=86663 RepID=A0ABN0WKQ9_9BACI
MHGRSQVYVDTVLHPIYQFTKLEFLNYILQINMAHVMMLEKQKIIPKIDAEKMLLANHKILKEGFPKEYDPQFEDLFFMLEDQMKNHIGEELVGNMHIAFSRNDMDATMFRMHWRKKVTQWIEVVATLQQQILKIASEQKDTIMTAYTHNQQAQPTTVSHYLLAIASHLNRDMERGLNLLSRINESPMGAAALGTTGFPIDREYIAELLGFDKAMENSYDSIAAADYMLEIGTTLSIFLSTLSRFVYDLMFLATNEVNGIRLDASLVQTSSIMPQKRNPSSLEHTRSTISSTLGKLQGIFYLSHSVPFGDIVDIGDDIQPSIQEGINQSISITTLLTEILKNTTFNSEKLLNTCTSGFSTVTELADTLVRHHGFSFRLAHKVVQDYVRKLSEKDLDLKGGDFSLFREIVANVAGRDVQMSEGDYKKAIDPEHFIRLRAIKGGPNPNETERQRGYFDSKLTDVNQKLALLNQRFQQYEKRFYQFNQMDDVRGN